jgi:type I restriction enzyme R subunit
VKLADGKARNIQHMMVTSFWHPGGTPMSARQFMELLFGKLPAFFKDEEELRRIWSDPTTRSKLREGLASQGFAREQLVEIQRIISAENCDLFDVLAHIAYAVPTETREARASRAELLIQQQFTTKQQAFLTFVLAEYIKEGVDELATEKLSPLLKLRYHNAIADAVADLGDTTRIRTLFTGFQKFLYQVPAVSGGGEPFR